MLGVAGSEGAGLSENPRVGGSTPSQATKPVVPPDELTRGERSAWEAETPLTLAVLWLFSSRSASWSAAKRAEASRSMTSSVIV